VLFTTNPKKNDKDPKRSDLKWYGLDLIKGVVRDSKAAGVLEPALIKIKSIKLATEAAITILRIDDLIKLFPEKKDDGNSYQEALRSGQLAGH